MKRYLLIALATTVALPVAAQDIGAALDNSAIGHLEISPSTAETPLPPTTAPTNAPLPPAQVEASPPAEAPPALPAESPPPPAEAPVPLPLATAVPPPIAVEALAPAPVEMAAPVAVVVPPQPTEAAAPVVLAAPTSRPASGHPLGNIMQRVAAPATSVVTPIVAVPDTARASGLSAAPPQPAPPHAGSGNRPEQRREPPRERRDIFSFERDDGRRDPFNTASNLDRDGNPFSDADARWHYTNRDGPQDVTEIWGYQRRQRLQRGPGDRDYDSRFFTGYTRNWDRSWRDRTNFDWRRLRKSNARLFTFPVYVNPYGRDYVYRPFAVGDYLDPRFSTAELVRPGQFGLPDAYKPFRWVRYYDDALVVDMRNGKIVDVVFEMFF